MRTKNSINNIAFSLTNNILGGILKFVLRTVFIKILGETVLGINGLFTNVLSILSLTDLGVSTAISFSLYKHIASKDNKKIAAYMMLYKKIYRWIAVIISIIGIVLLPFMKYLINDYETVLQKAPYINWVYILFLLNTVITYLMSYKRTLIVADQKEYKIAPFIFIFNLIVTIAQVIVLVLTKNFIFYLIIQMIIKVIENIFVNRYIDIRYKEIKEYTSEKLDKSEISELKTNVQAMAVHKFGDICIYSTDNLIISKLVSIAAVGFYSNYLMTVSVLKGLAGMIFSNLTASFGNLIATESDEKKEEVFNTVNFLAFLVYSFSGIIMMLVFNPFIKLWIGEKFVLSFPIVILIILDYFLYGLRTPISIIKASAGIYKQDVIVPIVTAIINLVVSIILGKTMGIEGVLIGTLVATLSLSIWYRPFIIYKLVFKSSPKKYFITLIKYIVIFLFNAAISYFAVQTIKVDNALLKIIYSIIVTSAIQTVVIYILFRDSKEIKKLLEVIKSFKA